MAVYLSKIERSPFVGGGGMNRRIVKISLVVIVLIFTFLSAACASHKDTHIAYISHDGAKIYSISGNGDMQTLVDKPANIPDLHFGRIAWSPDGSKLAAYFSLLWESEPVDGGCEGVLIADGNGSNQKLVWLEKYRCNLAFGSPPWPLAWSPDGKNLLVDMTFDRGMFYVVSSDGVNSFATDGGQPSWSPDGKKIVFSTWDDSEEYSIWIMNADGGSKRRIVTDGGFSTIWIPK
jgi:Tol biopolymer transport system component